MIAARDSLLALTLLGIASNAVGASALKTAVAASKPLLDLRLRSESVQQGGFAADAGALTLRARLGFETGKVMNTQLLAEGSLLLPLNARYNDTVNGRSRYPIVADPENYALNRLQFTNTSIPGTTLVLGRQRWLLDDQRFVGNSGWRQNEQTFDAFRISNRSIQNLTLDLAYVAQVNRVFGRDSPVGRFRGATYILNASYQTSIGKLTGFGYLLKLDRAPTDSSRTVGVRFNGERALKRIKFAYSASFATQSDAARNPLQYHVNYSAVELAASLRQVTLTAGIETLTGDGIKGFSTPLATLHKFQGWADKFLTTPPNGIDDRFFGVGYSRKKLGPFDEVSALANYHWFRSERRSIDYGTELDMQVQLKRREFAATLKYADYAHNAFSTDTRKLWLQLEYVR